MSAMLILNRQHSGIGKMRKIIVSLFLLSFVTFSSVISPENVSAYLIDGSELVNSLEAYREVGFKDEWDAASYVISKYWLQSTIDNKQEIIDYFDNRQWEDGAWGEHDDSRPKEAMAVLYAYFLLDAKPKKSLDSFFSQYDTWEEVLPYRPGHERGGKYHLVLAWACYYLRYPPWMTELFSFFEQDLDWTTSTRVHTRSHILYCYLIARRPFPNLDGIIEATLTQQYSDGSWRDPSLEALAETAVQIELLTEIMFLYPYHPRLSEMQNAINKAKPIFENNYDVNIINDTRYAFFKELTTGNPRNDLFFLITGILGSVLSGTTQGDTDPLFQILVSRIIDQEEILNYLDYNLERGEELGLLSLAFTLDSYELLGMETPNKSQVIAYLDGLQSNEGTWATGQNHYVPITAQILMFYNRLGVEPEKSLEPFFSSVDTWGEVVNHVQTYNPENIWGGLWGYVASYVVYKEETPPWTNEFLNEVIGNFDSWAYFNHQRTHVIGSLFLLSEPVPRIDDVLEIALEQQEEDGSWDHNGAETASSIQILILLENEITIDKNLIDSAIDRGIEFIEKCYKTIESEGETYAGFAINPSYEYPSIMGTAFGIWALLNPESDIWFRWSADVRAHTDIFNIPWNDSNFTIILESNSTVTNFNFNYSLKQISFNVTGLAPRLGYCNISIPKLLMWCDSPSEWNVTVDGSPVSHLTIIEDTHTFLYFTYNHSTHEVIIEAVNAIPEFSSAIMLLLFMMIILLGVVFAKRTLPRDRERDETV